jgi:polyferredoxin
VRRYWPQIIRRSLQLGVFVFIFYTAFGAMWRNYKTAHNHRRLVTLMHGETWGDLYGANEDMLSKLGEPYEQSLNFLGGTWASTIGGIDGADPILVAANVTTTGSITADLLLGLLLPLGIALLLGKVFCSHLCPMRLIFEVGQMIRLGLVRVGVPLPELRHGDRFGAWVLAGGLLATMIAGGAVWFFILPYVAVSTTIFLYVSTGVVVSLIGVAALWAAIDMLIAPGYWCKNLCPTGFILENVGRLSLLKLRKTGTEPCPDKCNQCEKTCPYALSPKEETHMPACDNCGRCVPACPKSRLVRRFALPVLTLLGILAFPSMAEAHHNKGLPHYGYFDNYPQVPVNEYIAIQGRWEIGATFFNFQGLQRQDADTPNDVKIYSYLYDLENDVAYIGPVDFEIRKGSEVVATYHREIVDEEAVYSTRQTMPSTGEYTLVAIVDGHEIHLPFYIDVGGDGINWLLIGGIALPVIILFGLAIAGRKRRRKRKRKRPGKQAVATAALLLGLVVAPAASYASIESPDHVHEVTDAEGEVCPYCGMVNCTMEHVETADGSSVMIMGGLPLWLFLVGIGGILFVSFIGTEVLAPRVKQGFRVNLIANKKLYRLVRSRWFQAIPQMIMVGILGLLIYVGLAGSRVANLTPVAVWTLWWGGLIFIVLFLGSAWCFMCPWDGLANLGSRLRAAARVDTLSLGLKFPSWLANVYPAIGLFVLLTWLELGFGVTQNPRTTAYMGIAMAGAAIAFALLFEGKKFCAHACPVGRICGTYSRFAPIEVASKRQRVCDNCKTEDCLYGNERGYPCPTGISLKTITSTTNCTLCTECIKSCDKQNIAFNLRPFGAELRKPKGRRLDEAWLALALLSLTLFHGLTMTPVWEDVRPGTDSILKWMSITFETPKVWNFTIAMAIACALPIVLYWLSCRAARYLAGGEVNARTLFVNYAYSLLPVALFYHLAHNLMHLLMEGGHIVPMLSDPMGDGSDYIGTASMHLGHLTSEATMWYMQVGLILTGHIFGIVVAHRTSRRLYADRSTATRSLIPMLLVMIAISIGGLYLMHLDMSMRVGRM